MMSRTRCPGTGVRRVCRMTAVVLFLMIGWGASLTAADETQKAITRQGQQPNPVAEEPHPAKSGDTGGLLEKLSQRAAQGQPEAQYQLGVIYLRGKGISKDLGQAAGLLRRAAERGIAEAQYQLGLLYLTGDGVMKDYAEAAKWIRKAADQGLADAQYDYGVLCHFGDGVPKDDAEASKWYALAAEQDHRHAKYALDRLQTTPTIMPDQQPKASPALRISRILFRRNSPRPQEGTKDLSVQRARLLELAERGDAEAQFQLGSLYERGDEVSRDYGQTLKWYRRAAKQGHQGAKRQLLKTVEALQKLSANGIEGLIKLAEQGDAWIQTLLAYRYMQGIGIPRDRAEALKWFRQSSRAG